MTPSAASVTDALAVLREWVLREGLQSVKVERVDSETVSYAVNATVLREAVE